jgi:hypothetical protein
MRWRARQFFIAFMVAAMLATLSYILDRKAEEGKTVLPPGTNKSQIAPIDIDAFMRSSDQMTIKGGSK